MEEITNKIFHVIVRGNDKNTIFNNDSDKRKYLFLLKKYKKKYDFNLLAYVIMDNHAHILIEEKEIFLSRIMQAIQISYSKYYNTKYNKTGHVFEKRYKKIISDSRENLLQLVKYIHKNPEKIGVNLDEYIWSSHSEYVNNSEGIVDKELLYNELSTNKDRDTELYISLMRY